MIQELPVLSTRQLAAEILDWRLDPLAWKMRHVHGTPYRVKQHGIQKRSWRISWKRKSRGRKRPLWGGQISSELVLLEQEEVLAFGDIGDDVDTLKSHEVPQFVQAEPKETDLVENKPTKLTLGSMPKEIRDMVCHQTRGLTINTNQFRSSPIPLMTILEILARILSIGKTTFALAEHSEKKLLLLSCESVIS